MIPGVHKIYSCDPFWDKSPLMPKGSFRKFIANWWRIRREGFDLAIVTGACWRSALFVKLAGIKTRIGYDKKKVKLFLSHTVPMFQRNKPVVNELLRLLNPLKIPIGQTYYKLNGPSIPLAQQPKTAFVALHPFSGNPKRCATLDFWHQIASYIKSKGIGVIWVGADKELKNLKERFSYGDDEFITAYVDENNLSAVASLAFHGKAFIGHDSGPLHVSGAMGVKTLGFYLPSEYERTFPQGPNKSPWIKKDRPADLGIEEVSQAIDQLLKI